MKMQPEIPVFCGYSSQSEDDTETEDEESEIMKKFDRNNADDED